MNEFLVFKFSDEFRSLACLSKLLLEKLNKLMMLLGRLGFLAYTVLAFVCVFAEVMAEMESADWLLELLQDVQLEQFYVKLRDNLQVTRYTVLGCLCLCRIVAVVFLCW